MAKITVKVKQAIHNSVNRGIESMGNFDASTIDWSQLLGLVMDAWNGEIAKHIKAALRERDYQIQDNEELLDAAVLTREISRKSGIQFSDITNKDAVMADLDAHISGRFNAALGTDVRGLLQHDQFKSVMVNLIVEQVENGRMVGVMSRMRAAVIRKGVVYSRGFAGQQNTFDVAAYARKLDNRKYMVKYRYNNKQVWD